MSTKKKSKKRGRKKRKLNTRLLTIVALIGIMLAGVVGGLIYLKIKGGVSRNMAAARAFLEEDQHIKALRSVGKVLYQESGNQDAHTLRIAIYEDMVPETPERASQLYREYLAAVSQHAQFTPESESLAIRALDEWWRAAMARESGVTALLRSGQVPAIDPRVLELIDEGCVPGGTRANLKAATTTSFAEDVPESMRLLLADAQTSGGLLLAVPPANLDQVLALLGEEGAPCAEVIGEMSEPGPNAIEVH